MTPRAVPGSFAASMFGAAARGTGLVALAVAIGVVLLQLSDDTDSPPLAAGRERIEVDDRAAGETSTTTTTAPAAAPSTAATPTTASPAPDGGARDITVLVLNASGRDNQARPLSERLTVVGYRTLEPGNAPQRETTTVLCRPRAAERASALVAATGLSAKVAELEEGSEFPGSDAADCVVVIGAR